MFTRGYDQLASVDVENARKIADVRIHVERIIGSVRQRFQILSVTGVLQNECVSHKTQNGSVILDSIVRVCCAFNNVNEGVITLSHPYMSYV